MTVRELLSKTDSRELTEWMIYLNLDHWKDKFLTAKQSSDRIKKALFGKMKVNYGNDKST